MSSPSLPATSAVTGTPPRGSAYGVRIKMSESRLAGRLPVNNCFALGHHAIMPGILGSILGAFLTFRLAAGEEQYNAVVANARSGRLAVQGWEAEHPATPVFSL